MKATLVATVTFAAMALANPLFQKRDVVTQWVEETVTVTVTAGQEVATATAAPAANTQVQTQAAAAPTSASVSTSSGSSSGNAGSYGQPILDQHNYHRQNNSAPALVWDDDLASIAQQIAETCVYEHNVNMGGGGYGQNIGAGAPGTDVPAMITNQMYNDEINSYPGYGGEPDMGNFDAWGHYSQIVWVNTQSVGCYTAYCGSGLANVGSDVSPYFTVCNYKPPGNYAGQYAANVLQPLGEATISI